MGRLFLLALVCVIGYSIWNVFSGGDDEEGGEPVETSSKSSDAVVLDGRPVVNEEESEKVSQAPEPLFVSGAARDFLFIHDWGICREGDWLPCGRVLKRWSDKLAVVFDGQKEVVLRFARAVEFPQVVADASSTGVSGQGADASSVGGSGSSTGATGSDGVASVVNSFFGSGE